MDPLSSVDNTTLCLACSSSLPPRRPYAPSASSSTKSCNSENDIFITPCCHRPICPACLASNPRLARYNPCLHCLGGVAIVSARSSPLPQSRNGVKADTNTSTHQNIDGGVYDKDLFVLGDEDEDEGDFQDGADEGEDMSAPSSGSSTGLSTPPPPYEEESPSTIAAPGGITSEAVGGMDSSLTDSDPKSSQIAAPLKYYIKPGDTLLGISLKYGIDGYLLCRLNGLPPSTLRTTPHILHTRTFLTLPPTMKAGSSLTSSADEKARDTAYEARRARERAERRLQTMTKEVDRRIAKAYVAIAEHDEGEDVSTQEEMPEVKPLEKKIQVTDPFTGAEHSLEARAIDRYLDDDEWEAQERAGGRGVSVPRFPLSEPKGKSTSSKSWWRLR